METIVNLGVLTNTGIRHLPNTRVSQKQLAQKHCRSFKISVFWNAEPSSLVNRYQLFHPEDGYRRFLQRIGTFQSNNTAEDCSLEDFTPNIFNQAEHTKYISSAAQHSMSHTHSSWA
jgi:hypothetical protein